MRRNFRFHLECLETRQMMAGNSFAPLPYGELDVAGNDAGATAYTAGMPASTYEASQASGPVTSGFVGPIRSGSIAFVYDGVIGPRSTEVFDPTRGPEDVRDLEMGLPLLDSMPGASRTLHLDFTGSSFGTFTNNSGTFPRVGAPIVTPAYDTNFNAASFDATEQEEIRQIWARVAEDFAPFNINVTTHYYGPLSDGNAVKVAIGGNPTDWYIDWETNNSRPSGTSSVGSFSAPDQPNVVFVFSNIINLWSLSSGKDGDRRSINMIAATANTASHEAGHAFGLEHHSRYSLSGKETYDPGTALWTPIMGDNLASDRTTWSDGETVDGPGIYQDDMAILAGLFGYRSDDHAYAATADATPLNVPMTAFQAKTGKGILEHPNDRDAFQFTSSGGSLHIEVKSAKFGPNLWVSAELWSANGFVSYNTSGGLFDSVINVNVPAGTYYVIVKGFGDYGDVGQYTVAVGGGKPAANGGGGGGVGGAGGATTVVDDSGMTFYFGDAVLLPSYNATYTGPTMMLATGDGAGAAGPVAEVASSRGALPRSRQPETKTVFRGRDELELEVLDAAFEQLSAAV